MNSLEIQPPTPRARGYPLALCGGEGAHLGAMAKTETKATNKAKATTAQKRAKTKAKKKGKGKGKAKKGKGQGQEKGEGESFQGQEQAKGKSRGSSEGKGLSPSPWTGGGEEAKGDKKGQKAKGEGKAPKTAEQVKQHSKQRREKWTMTERANTVVDPQGYRVPYYHRRQRVPPGKLRSRTESA